MEASIGRITARLALPAEQISDEKIDLINKNINPPEPVEADDVFIRAMYIVSDEVNSFGGRFPADEHERLAELLIDSPVLVGHRKDKLPIGRTFHATTVERDGKQWVKSYFFWLKHSEGAESLKENIDGGVYKECSIGFTFLLPECSVCGKDMRTCEHEPLGQYDVNGATITAHFNYRQVERALETSLVYRGALPNTAVAKELKLGVNTASISNDTNKVYARSINDLAELEDCERYLVTPYYSGLPVSLNVDDGKTIVSLPTGRSLERANQALSCLTGLPNVTEAKGILIGCRGKERLPIDQLQRYLDGASSPVTRLELKLLPPLQGTHDCRISVGGPHKVSVIRHAITSRDRIHREISAMATIDGALIWPISLNHTLGEPALFKPRDGSESDGGYSLGMTDNDDTAILRIRFSGNREAYLIRQFNLSRLKRGGRFVADLCGNGEMSAHYRPLLKGRLDDVKRSGEGRIMNISDGLSGIFCMRPIKLDGRKRCLFYQAQ